VKACPGPGFALAFIAVLVAGCGTATTELALRSRALTPVAANRPETSREGRVAATPVFIAPVVDERLDPESLGHVANRSFAVKAVPGLVDRTLRESIEKRLPLVSATAEAELVLRPSLHKCYLASVDATKVAVVVVVVTFVHRGRDAGYRVYRGQHASMNWWNSDTELAGALQAAFDDCVAHIVIDTEARAKLIATQKKA
jgi:hypothetical protein